MKPLLLTALLIFGGCSKAPPDIYVVNSIIHRPYGFQGDATAIALDRSSNHLIEPTNTTSIFITGKFLVVTGSGALVEIPAANEADRKDLVRRFNGYPGLRIMTLCESHTFLHDRKP